MQAALYWTKCHFGGVILPWLVFIRMRTYNPLFTKTDNICLYIFFLTVHHVMIIAKWPTWRTYSFSMYLLLFLTLYMFRAHRAHHQDRQIVSLQPLVNVTLSCAHDTATDTEWQLPEVVLTQFVSPDDEHDVLETGRELKIKINTQKGICASSWSFTKTIFVFYFLMVTVAGYEFCGYWLRTLIVEQIKEEERLSHVSTPETNSWTVICGTFKEFSFLMTYSEEVYTVSEVFFKFQSNTLPPLQRYTALS